MLPRYWRGRSWFSMLSLSANVLWFEMAKQTHWQHNSSPFLRSFSYPGPPNLPIVITNGQCSVFNLLDPWALSDTEAPPPFLKPFFACLQWPHSLLSSLLIHEPLFSVSWNAFSSSSQHLSVGNLRTRCLDFLSFLSTLTCLVISSSKYHPYSPNLYPVAWTF